MPGMNTKNAAISETINSFSRSSVVFLELVSFLANFSVNLYQALTITLLIFCWLLYYLLLRHNNTSMAHSISSQPTTQTFVVTFYQTAVRDEGQQVAASEEAVICPIMGIHSISS